MKIRPVLFWAVRLRVGAHSPPLVRLDILTPSPSLPAHGCVPQPERPAIFLIMSTAYHELLDAAIRELETQQARGVRHVHVAPETLASLSRPAAAPNLSATAPSAPPAPAKTPAAAQPFLPPPVRKPVFPRPAAAVSVGATDAPMRMADPLPAPALPTLDPATKAAAFTALRAKVRVCVKCPNLAVSRQTVVFGVGNPEAQLMFVGEAPGAEEDAQGEPFVGAAGQLLTKIIQAMGQRRDTVYITNLLKCRPDTPGASDNRKPTAAEMQTCLPWLHEQIDLVRPRVLVALGATAVEGLLGKTLAISKLRGNWQTYRGIPLLPTYHPAYLIHNQALSEKRKVWEDMLAVMEKLQMPISEKQRGFFLRAP